MSRLGCIAWEFRPTSSTSLRVPWRRRGSLSQQRPNGTAFVIGEGGLLNALHTNGYSIVDHDPDYVVVGEGRAVTLEMLELAVQMILEGAKLIATNLDPNCPTARGPARAAERPSPIWRRPPASRRWASASRARS